MVNWNIFDTAFAHIECSVPGKKPKYLSWNRKHHDYNDPTFYTHEQMLTDDIGPNSYGLLIESQSIIGWCYSAVRQYMDKFKLVFTHSSELLRDFPNARWISGSSVWINGTYGGGEYKLYPKFKGVSIVSSNKQMCPLHVERSRLVNSIRQYGVGIDTFGDLTSKWVPIIESLADYRYSVIIENYIDETSPYFTEKLLNCFATGTIPVYYGSKSIGKKFNMDGIIELNAISDIWGLYSSLTEENYYKRYDAIEDNFERCKQYDVLEDYIYENYFQKESV